MVNNIGITRLQWWYDENVKDIKDEVDAFLDKASHPDWDVVYKLRDDALATKTIPKLVFFCFINYKNVDNCYYLFFKSWIDNLKGYTFVNMLPEFIEHCEFSKFCLDIHKFAYYTDYARVYFTYNYGGLYMDADVMIIKPYDDLLKYPYLFDIEDLPYYCPIYNAKPGIQIEPAVFAVTPHMCLLKDIMQEYKNVDIDKIKQEYEYQEKNVRFGGIHYFTNNLVINNFWNNAISNNNYTQFHSLSDLHSALEKWFNEHPFNIDEKNILINNGSNFGISDTDYINRLYYLLHANKLEWHKQPHTYSCHQVISMHINKAMFSTYEVGIIVPILEEIDNNEIQHIQDMINKNHSVLTIYFVFGNNINSQKYLKLFKKRKGDKIFSLDLTSNKHITLDELITAETFYNIFTAFNYIIIFKPNTIIHSTQQFTIFKSLFWIQNEQKNPVIFDWLGKFNNQYHLHVRNVIKCIDICHRYPNYEALPDEEYFQKYSKEMSIKLYSLF